MLLSLYLFGKPAWVFGCEGHRPNPKALRGEGESLRRRLHLAAEIQEKLEAAGWTTTLSLYDLEFSHPDRKGPAEVISLLAALGINPGAVTIHEEDESPADAG